MKYGSKIITNTVVEKVLLEMVKPLGVMLNDGRREYADLVFASGGAKETFEHLVGRENISRNYLDILDDILPMEAVFMVHLGLDIDPLLYQNRTLLLLPDIRHRLRSTRLEGWEIP